MELTPIQRRRYIRLDNRHKARRLERCVFLVVELFRTLKEGWNVQPGERNAWRVTKWIISPNVVGWKKKKTRVCWKQSKRTRVVAMRNPFVVLRKLGQSNTIRAREQCDSGKSWNSSAGGYRGQVNVMEEITFKRLLADKVILRRSSSVLRAYQSNDNPRRLWRSWESLRRLLSRTPESPLPRFMLQRDIRTLSPW